MNEINREEIIKALECCTSGNSVSACMSGCPLYEQEDCECVNDDTALLKYALLLIKELTEENERLHASCTELTQCCTKLETLYKIECKRVDTVKADTVRKMQERLKAIKPLSITTEYGYDFEGVELKYIDQIAKEMLEG